MLFFLAPVSGAAAPARALQFSSQLLPSSPDSSPPNLPPPEDVLVTLAATDFVPYFDYAGPFAVEGSLSIATTPRGAGKGTTQIISGALSGLDPLCVNGPNVSVSPNSCGLHLHEGTDCTSDAGGKYFATPEDPWGVLHYQAGSTVETVTLEEEYIRTNLGCKFIMNVGFPGKKTIEGHAFIVHGFDGDGIACALLAPAPPSPAPPRPTEYCLAATDFVPYFDYAGPFAVEGSLSIATTPRGAGQGTTQIISGVLSGLDPLCVNGPNVSVSPNSCGLHLHEGTDCTSDAGGKYFATPEDPWGVLHYQAGSTVETVILEEEYIRTNLGCFAAINVDFPGKKTIEGHAFIVHGFDGDGIACAVLATAACP